MELVRQPRIGRFVWWLGLLSTLFVLFCGSVIAYLDGLPSVVQRVPHLDKACHFGVFGAIAFFLDGVLRRRALRLATAAVPVAAALVLVPAGVEEYVQRYSSNRSSSIWDFLADLLGVVSAIALSRRVALEGER